MSMNTESELEEELDTIDIEDSPVKLSSFVAVGTAIIAALTSAPFALLALPLGIGGVGVIAAGLLLVNNRTWVTIGSVMLFLSVIIAAGIGAPVEFVLVSMAATALTWDIGQNAISLGEQMGRHTETARNEIIHASASTIIAMLTTGFGYIVYLTAGGGRPTAALMLLLFGIVFLIWAIRT